MNTLLKLLLIGTVILILICAAVVVLMIVVMPTLTPTDPTPAPVSNAAWYEVYFTTPRYPDRAGDHTGGIDMPLAALINSAQSSVDMAIYQLDSASIVQALLSAQRRGVTVRIVTDINILNDAKENAAFKKLQADKIPVIAGNPNAIMHNKFVIVDKRAVWTGSWNFTENDTYRYNNNGILIQSAELARNYTVTFEKMFSQNQFGRARKAGGTTPRLTIEGATIENYFAPEDKVADKIIARLKQATRTIDFLAFAFTDDDIGNVVRDRAQSGVVVRGVFETTGSETSFSEYGKMKRAGLDVWQDGNPYLMHHKVFIVDSRTVILGSFNFSQNAENENDENLLILDDAALAQTFTAEFLRLYEQAKNSPKK